MIQQFENKQTKNSNYTLGFTKSACQCHPHHADLQATINQRTEQVLRVRSPFYILDHEMLPESKLLCPVLKQHSMF